jgi:hypothetical protein
MKEISDVATFNTLSRIWQVMTHGALELKSAMNPKQSFDMLIIRMINIADLPPVSQILENTNSTVVPKVVKKTEAVKSNSFESAADISTALSEDKEIILLSEWNNCKVSDFAPGKIKLCYEGRNGTFLSDLSLWLKKKTDMDWEFEFTDSVGGATIAEESVVKMKSDPLVADALNLFADANVVEIK